jgi:hypothetical protein
MADGDSGNYWPAQSLKAAIGCFVLGVVLFVLLFLFEAAGGNWRDHWLMGPVQKIGGKWAVAVIFGALGVFFLAMALIGSSRSDESPPSK